MHLPDHYLSEPVQVATGVLAGVGLLGATWFARGRFNTSGQTRWTTPAIGAAVFALQMLNYPVDDATSGHVLGGVAAALLAGPVAAMWLLAAVLSVQAIVFADGGLFALGANVLNMTLVGVWSGWAVWRMTERFGRDQALQIVRAALAGWVSGQCAALCCACEILASGLQNTTFVAEMFRVHALIGIGEAGLAAAAQALMIATVSRASSLRTTLIALTAGLAICLTPFASALPDGLEATGERFGLIGQNIATAFDGWRWADYQVPGWGETAASTLVAGILGAVIVAGCGLAVRRPLRD